MPSDLFPVAMTFFRSVASLMLEHSRTSVQDNVILFSLKKKYLKVKKSEYIIILDFLGYFTIISNIQKYTGFSYAQKTCKVNVVLKKDLIVFCGVGGWYDIWFESCRFQMTVEPPLTNLQLSSIADWQIGNCSFFIVGLNKGLVLSVAHLLFSKQTEFLSRGSERISYLCRPSEQLSWDKINDKQSLSIAQTVIIVWHSPQEYIASINQHSVGVFLLVLSDASVIFVGHLNNIHETKLIINKVYP